ncbi:MAG TPA: D-aminoacylase [Vicinamibacterales bacterium]|jgi:N-acyl-D-aspartate/D-glutamate deacylase|nr:D-aminoacylase [Vicinamibacterales bacterium]
MKAAAGASVLAVAWFFIGAQPPARPFDLLITNARIIDGSGRPSINGSVGVRDGRIAAVGRVAGPAGRTIDAHGQVVAPGFIDAHSHSDFSLLTDGNAESKIRQGVTTEVIGESGSVAPRARLAPGVEAPDTRGTGVRPEWTDFAGYFAQIARSRISVNLLSYVGLGQVREFVMGNDDRAPTAAELQKMTAIVADSMKQGAYGVATGLIYSPNAYAKLDELIALSKPAAAAGGLYASHLRYDGDKLRDGINEAIAIGEGARIPVHIFHLKVTGQKNFGRMKEAIVLIEAAQKHGLEISADQYPYVASSTGLSQTIPPWAHEGGGAKLAERLKDPATRAKIRREMDDPAPTWENRLNSAGTWHNVQLASIPLRPGAEAYKKYEGMRVDDAAKAAGRDPYDFVFDLLIAERGNVSCVWFIIDENDLKLAMKQPWVSVGSDGSALATSGPLRTGVPHPRNFGTFPRVLGKYVREEHVISLEQAVHKMSGLTASQLHIADRGLIKDGLAADLVIFDPSTVADRATFTDPFQYPVGIDTVIVNGRVVLDGGRHTGERPGVIIHGHGQ